MLGRSHVKSPEARIRLRHGSRIEIHVPMLQLSDNATQSLFQGPAEGPSPAGIAAVRSSLGRAFVPSGSQVWYLVPKDS